MADGPVAVSATVLCRIESCCDDRYAVRCADGQSLGFELWFGAAAESDGDEGGGRTERASEEDGVEYAGGANAAGRRKLLGLTVEGELHGTARLDTGSALVRLHNLAAWFSTACVHIRLRLVRVRREWGRVEGWGGGNGAVAPRATVVPSVRQLEPVPPRRRFLLVPPPLARRRPPAASREGAASPRRERRRRRRRRGFAPRTPRVCARTRPSWWSESGSCASGSHAAEGEALLRGASRSRQGAVRVGSRRPRTSSPP